MSQYKTQLCVKINDTKPLIEIFKEGKNTIFAEKYIKWNSSLINWNNFSHLTHLHLLGPVTQVLFAKKDVLEIK